MEHINGRIKIYTRKFKRRLKSGTVKEYKTRQHLVTLEDTNIFEDGAPVVVVSADDFEGLEKKFNDAMAAKERTAEMLERAEELIEHSQRVVNQMDKLRVKHDHLQERLRASLEEINTKDQVINDLSRRGVLDILLRRQPKSYKLLREAPGSKK